MSHKFSFYFDKFYGLVFQSDFRCVRQTPEPSSYSNSVLLQMVGYRPAI